MVVKLLGSSRLITLFTAKGSVSVGMHGPDKDNSLRVVEQHSFNLQETVRSVRQ